tara:strand:+ start:893 stop:1252 length:360 start_codon:yes stop_codon:yes gene_type:complete
MSDSNNNDNVFKYTGQTTLLGCVAELTITETTYTLGEKSLYGAGTQRTDTSYVAKLYVEGDNTNPIVFLKHSNFDKQSVIDVGIIGDKTAEEAFLTTYLEPILLGHLCDLQHESDDLEK